MRQTCDQLDVGICLTQTSEGHPDSWQIKPYVTPDQDRVLQPSTWVRLREAPSPYSSTEALLLCREGLNQWLAWVPDYGEISLSIHELQID
jgi:hypothetical protein